MKQETIRNIKTYYNILSFRSLNVSDNGAEHCIKFVCFAFVHCMYARKLRFGIWFCFRYQIK